MILGRDEVIFLVDALVDALENRGETASVQIVGGAAIAWLHHAERRGTVDVDALIAPRESVLRAASDIAARHNLPEGWLNDAVLNTGAVPFARDIEWTTVRAQGRVVVQVADARALLAMKLRASRPGRDLDDIVHLLRAEGVDSISDAEAAFDDYYPGEAISDRGLRILEHIFSESESRSAEDTREEGARP